jgi:hypothetical protein
MLRPSLTTAAVALLSASALAQGDLKSRLQPITAPLKNAGVFHVATGTWTRHGSVSNVTGPDTIYNNSCNLGYFSAQISGERWQHRSRVPSNDSDVPTTDSLFYGAARKDEAPGCSNNYTVNGFQFVYCSSLFTGPTQQQQHDFADSYTLCGGGDMTVTASQQFTITGLPGGTSTGQQICWIVDIDLDAASASFALSADGDGDWDGPDGLVDQFGWSMGPITLQTAGDGTGPVLAGNYTWTGGPTVGALTPCTGTDGTVWDCPINLSEEGTGMTSNDFFRVTGTAVGVPSGPGCYFFGGTVHADFYLKLFSDLTCTPSNCGPMTQFCRPGVDTGIIACPCSNPPTGVQPGCNNFGGGDLTTGAGLNATGTTDDSADTTATPTVFLTATGTNTTALNVFWSGKPPAHATGLVHGAGVRCVTVQLKRLYTASASGGVVTRPRLPAGTDPSVSQRHTDTGAPLAPPETRYYFNIYRDPAAAAPCGVASSTINLTNAGSMNWVP